MKEATSKLWINGEIEDATTPHFMVDDRGSALGDGLFETIKIHNGKPCYFKAHYARLCASAEILQLVIPYDHHSLEQALVRLARENKIVTGAARLVFSRGQGPRGLALPEIPRPLVMITMASGLPHFEEPPILGLSSIRRNSWSISCRHKTLSYVDNIAARLHQENQIPRDEVIMIDSAGHVASTSVANVFWWRDGRLYTPSLECAILPGTMRARVLEQARRLGLPVNEGRYQPDDMLRAQIAFMTNALIGIQIVAGLDFGPVGKTSFTQTAPQIETLNDTLTGQ